MHSQLLLPSMHDLSTLHKLLYVMSSNSHISTVISSLTHRIFRSIFMYFQTNENFLFIFSVIYLQLNQLVIKEHTLYYFSPLKFVHAYYEKSSTWYKFLYFEEYCFTQLLLRRLLYVCTHILILIWLSLFLVLATSISLLIFFSYQPLRELNENLPL